MGRGGARIEVRVTIRVRGRVGDVFRVTIRVRVMSPVRHAHIVVALLRSGRPTQGTPHA